MQFLLVLSIFFYQCVAFGINNNETLNTNTSFFLQSQNNSTINNSSEDVPVYIEQSINTSNKSSTSFLQRISPMLSLLSTSKCSNADEVATDVTYAYIMGTKTDDNKNKVLTGLNSFKDWARQFSDRNGFLYNNNGIVGYMWIGSMLQNNGFANNIISIFEDEVKNYGIPASGYVEYVNGDPMKSFGVVFYTDSSKLSEVQRAGRLWSMGQSFNTKTGSKVYSKQSACYLSYANRKPIVNDNEAGDCEIFVVKQGQNAEDTAGVNGESLQGYNSGIDFSKLQPGQTLCKSIGKVSPSCKSGKNVDLKYGYIGGTKTDDNKNKILGALDKFYSQCIGELDRETFMYNSNGIIGMVWVGSKISNKDFAANVINLFKEEVNNYGIPTSGFLEYVNGDPNESVGVILYTDSSKFEDVQRAGKLWSMGKPFDKQDGSKIYTNKNICYLENRKTIKNDEKNIGECITFLNTNDFSPSENAGIDIDSLSAYNPGVDTFHHNYVYCNSIGKLDVDIKEATFNYAWWTGTDNKQEVKKQAVLKALDSYSNWSKQFRDRQSFKIQNSEIIGFMWIGERVDTQLFIDNFIKTFKDEVNGSGFPNLAYLEYITGDPMTSCGIVFDINPSKIDNVAKAVKLWSQGKPFNFSKGNKEYKSRLGFLNFNSRKFFNNDKEVGECSYISYDGGINPYEICDIPKAVFYEYNINFEGVSKGYPLCCSIGNRPDNRPKNNDDGSCYSHTLKSGDTCESLSSRFFPLTEEDIDNFNKNNKNWYGCNLIIYGNKICLSDGNLI